MTPQTPLFSDSKHLRATQYKDDSNLNARMALHIQYGINKTRWPDWVFDQFDFPTGSRVLEVAKERYNLNLQRETLLAMNVS